MDQLLAELVEQRAASDRDMAEILALREEVAKEKSRADALQKAEDARTQELRTDATPEQPTNHFTMMIEMQKLREQVASKQRSLADALQKAESATRNAAQLTRELNEQRAESDRKLFERFRVQEEAGMVPEAAAVVKSHVDALQMEKDATTELRNDLKHQRALNKEMEMKILVLEEQMSVLREHLTKANAEKWSEVEAMRQSTSDAIMKADRVAREFAKPADGLQDSDMSQMLKAEKSRAQLWTEEAERMAAELRDMQRKIADLERNLEEERAVRRKLELEILELTVSHE